MISTNDLRPGVTIELDSDLWTVLEFQHVKPGKGAAFVRTKMRNVRSGNTNERTFRAGEKLVRALLERKEMQFLYEQSGEYNFMDTTDFEQIALPASKLGDTVKWMKEQTMVNMLFFGHEIIGVDPPNFVELEVTETDPGVRGDTATGGSKPATMETGAVVAVPFFINIGDMLKIDTRTGAYLERC
ncbi:MAG: elongation factor P [Candidatus Sericytochromatia bacterium]|nr:elongation factor P [Candidatus Sericytochromatia bacterium]